MWKIMLMPMLSVVCLSLAAATVDEIFNAVEKKSEAFKTLHYRTIYYDSEGNKIPASDSVTQMIRKDGKVLIHHATKASLEGQELEVEVLITPNLTFTRKKADGLLSYGRTSTRAATYAGMICHGMVLNDNANFKYTVLPDEKDGDLAMWVVEGEVKEKTRNTSVPARIVWKFDKASGLTVRTEAFNSNGVQILRGRVYDIRVDQEINEALFNLERFEKKD